MSKKSDRARNLSPVRCKEEFSSIFKQLCCNRRFSEVWGDCMEVFAVVAHQQSYYNPTWMPPELETVAIPIDDDFERLEEKYMSFVPKYQKEGMSAISKLYSLAQYAVQQWGEDFLGQVYESLEIVSGAQQSASGEFLTPASVSKLMAQLTLGRSIDSCIQRKGYVTCQEPACGSGRMLLALVDEMYNLDHDPRVCLFIEAIDTNRDMFNMTYAQLSWLDLPALVIHGNTLSMEMFEFRYTPQYKLSKWHYEKNPIYVMLKFLKDFETGPGPSLSEASSEVSPENPKSSSPRAEPNLIADADQIPVLTMPTIVDDDGQMSLF